MDDLLRLRWNESWAPFRTPNLVFTASVFGAVGLGLKFLPDPPVGWKQPLLFDTAVRNTLRLTSEPDRDAASAISDALQTALVLYPFAEAGYVGLAEDSELGLTLALIDAESFAVSSLLMLLSKHLVGRIRPDTEPCADAVQPDDFTCRSKAATRSFFCAHCAASFTAASLVCIHHEKVGLFKDDTSDAVACGTMLGLAATTSVLRIVSDRHWATDTLAGAAVGVLTGYGLPYLLHYGVNNIDGEERRTFRGALRLYLLGGPVVRGGAASLGGGAAITLSQRIPIPLSSINEETSGEGTDPFSGQAAVVDASSQVANIHMSLDAEGRLLRTTDNFFFQEFASSLEIFAGSLLDPMFAPVGVGFAVDIRGQDGPPNGATSVAFGPALSIALYDGIESDIILRGRWFPAGDGSSDLFLASVEASFLRWAGIRLEAETLRAKSSEDGDVTPWRGAMCMLALGGRLPW